MLAVRSDESDLLEDGSWPSDFISEVHHRSAGHRQLTHAVNVKLVTEIIGPGDLASKTDLLGGRQRAHSEQKCGGLLPDVAVFVPPKFL